MTNYGKVLEVDADRFIKEIKDKAFNIGLALNRIAVLVDDDTFRKIKPSLSEIEAIVSDIIKEGDNVDTDWKNCRL